MPQNVTVTLSDADVVAIMADPALAALKASGKNIDGTAYTTDAKFCEALVKKRASEMAMGYAGQKVQREIAVEVAKYPPDVVLAKLKA